MAKIDETIKDLRDRRARLDEAISALERLANGTGGKARFSVEGMERIRAAQRKRWAKWKASHKK